MTLKEKLGWEGQLADRLKHVQESQDEIASGKAESVTYYWFVGMTAWYAVEVYLEGDSQASKAAAEGVVKAAIEYFYGDWRETLMTPDGKVGTDAWKPFCLWFEQVMESLPFAAALSDWKSMKRIADYPPEDKLPEAAKAKGVAAWGWALISFLRGQPRLQVEEFLRKAETDKAKRLKLLCPVLRALLDNNAEHFQRAFLAYLAYYQKSEFRRVVHKVLTLEGTTLYHLGRKQGFHVNLPESAADHIIRFQ